MRKLLRKSFFGLLSLFLWAGVLSVSSAAPMAQFTPPTDITVRMFQLLSGGGSTGILCSSDNTNYGCTAFVGNRLK